MGAVCLVLACAMWAYVPHGQLKTQLATTLAMGLEESLERKQHMCIWFGRAGTFVIPLLLYS